MPIPDKVFPAIRAWVEYRRNIGPYLFTTRTGDPLTHSGYVRMWGRIQKAMSESAGRQIDITAHTFRHNYCTMLCYQIPTISIKHIAALLGDTEAMVLKVYNHIVMEKEDSSRAVNAAL